MYVCTISLPLLFWCDNTKTHARGSNSTRVRLTHSRMYIRNRTVCLTVCICSSRFSLCGANETEKGRALNTWRFFKAVTSIQAHAKRHTQFSTRVCLAHNVMCSSILMYTALSVCNEDREDTRNKQRYRETTPIHIYISTVARVCVTDGEDKNEERLSTIPLSDD